MSKIELKNVTKYIINKKKKEGIAVIYDASVTFFDGKINVILGESGCGKTMLLKSISGIESIDEGHIYFNDIDYTETSPQLRNVSYLSQNFPLYNHLTIFDNIAYPLRIAGISDEEIKRRVEEMLELLGISILSTRRPKELSGGQKQKAALAKALIKHPDVLLLDEPLSNIDEQKRTTLLEEIKSLQQKLNLTIIYVTHQLREASYLADQIIVMNNGTIVETGTTESLFQNKKSFLYQNFIKPSEVNQ